MVVQGGGGQKDRLVRLKGDEREWALGHWVWSVREVVGRTPYGEPTCARRCSVLCTLAVYQLSTVKSRGFGCTEYLNTLCKPTELKQWPQVPTSERWTD